MRTHTILDLDKILSEVEKQTKVIKAKKITDPNISISIQASSASLSPFFLTPCILFFILHLVQF